MRSTSRFLTRSLLPSPSHSRRTTRARWRFAALVSLSGLLLAGGCASSPRTDDEGRPSAPRRGGQNLITELEIVQAADGGLETALDVVERLRPSMLRARAGTRAAGQNETTPGPMVYLDDQRLGETPQLRNIPFRVIKEIRLISPIDATQRWGTGHWGGVIQVLTRSKTATAI